MISREFAGVCRANYNRIRETAKCHSDARVTSVMHGRERGYSRHDLDRSFLVSVLPARKDSLGFHVHSSHLHHSQHVMTIAERWSHTRTSFLGQLPCHTCQCFVLFAVATRFECWVVLEAAPLLPYSVPQKRISTRTSWGLCALPSRPTFKPDTNHTQFM